MFTFSRDALNLISTAFIASRHSATRISNLRPTAKLLRADKRKRDSLLQRRSNNLLDVFVTNLDWELIVDDQNDAGIWNKYNLQTNFRVCEVWNREADDVERLRGVNNIVILGLPCPEISCERKKMQK